MNDVLRDWHMGYVLDLKASENKILLSSEMASLAANAVKTSWRYLRTTTN